MGNADHRLHAREAAADEIARRLHPFGLDFASTDRHAQYVAPVVGFHSHGDLHGERHDPAILTHLQLGGSDPEMEPFAFNRPEESVVVPFVNLFTKQTDLALEDAGAADCLPTQT